MARISIGLPVYNGEAFVAGAIESVLAQTLRDFELIISDNASMDRTGGICRAYAARETRIRYILQQRNLGAAANFNATLAHATSPYFKWLAHDDTIEPTFLETCVGFLERNPSYVLAAAKATICDADMTAVEAYDYDLDAESDDVAERVRSQIRGHQCHEIMGVIRTQTLRRTPPMGSHFAGDAVLLIRLVLQGKFYEAPERLMNFRHHASQSARYRTNLRKYMEWWDVRNAGRITFPYWKVFREYLASLWMYDMSARDRLRCLGHVLAWAVRRRRPLASDVMAAIPQGLSRLGSMTTRRPQTRV